MSEPSEEQREIINNYLKIVNKLRDSKQISLRIKLRAQKLINSIKNTSSAIDNDCLFDETNTIDDFSALNYPHLNSIELLQADLNSLKLQRRENFYHHIQLATKLLACNSTDETALIEEMDLLIQANHLIQQTITGIDINPTYLELCYAQMKSTIDAHEKNFNLDLKANDNRYMEWTNIQKNVSLSILVTIVLTVALLSSGVLAPILAAGVIGGLLLLQTVSAIIALAKMAQHYEVAKEITLNKNKSSANLGLQKNTLFVVDQTKKIEANYQALDKLKKQS